MIIYCAKNLVNRKLYIGYTTKKLSERIKQHLNKSKNKKNKHYFYLFQEAIRKYGIENFKWEILCECSSIQECCEMEKFYIKTLNTISPKGYNLTEGGNGGIQSEETKEKISNSLKNYYSNNEHPISKIPTEKRKEMALKSWESKKKNGYTPLKGYKHTDEDKFKMSNSKNEKNKIKWYNILTNELVELSLTKMSKYTNLSVGTFSHLKQNRQTQTKCGWIIKRD
jgi:group I intron endonuclease